MRTAFALILFLLLGWNGLARAADAPADVYKKIALHLEEDSRKNLTALIAQKERIIGLEAIVAEASDEHVYSRFGHVMLRFVTNGFWGNDMTLSFLANVDTPTLSIREGIFGGYPVLISLTTFQETWNQYIQGEGRPLTRYVIPVTRGQIDQVLGTLSSWSEHPEQVGNYRFFSRNCATVMEDLLEKSGLGYSEVEPEIPTHFGDWLVRSWISIYPSLKVENPFGVLKKAAQLLGVTQGELLAGRNWPADAAPRLLGGLDEKEIKLIYRTVVAMPFQVSIEIAKHVNYYTGTVSYDQVMGMSPVSKILYGVCDTDACFTELNGAMNELWGQPALKRNKGRISFWLRNTDLDFEYARAKADALPGEEIQAPFNLVKFPSQADATRKRDYLRRLAQ